MDKFINDYVGFVCHSNSLKNTDILKNKNYEELNNAIHKFLIGKINTETIAKVRSSVAFLTSLSNVSDDKLKMSIIKYIEDLSICDDNLITILQNYDIDNDYIPFTELDTLENSKEIIKYLREYL